MGPLHGQILLFSQTEVDDLQLKKVGDHTFCINLLQCVENSTSKYLTIRYGQCFNEATTVYYHIIIFVFHLFCLPFCISLNISERMTK